MSLCMVKNDLSRHDGTRAYRLHTVRAHNIHLSEGGQTTYSTRRNDMTWIAPYCQHYLLE